MKSGIKADRVKTTYILFAALFCFMRLLLVPLLGRQGVSYSVPVLEIIIIFSLAVPFASSIVITRLVRTRFRKERYESIKEIISLSEIHTFLIGLVCFLVLILGSRLFALYIAGEEHLSLVFMMASPVFILLSTVGTITGYCRGMGMTSYANKILLTDGVLTFILSPICGLVFKGIGSNVSDLYRDSSYTYVYGAAGVMAGILVASLVTFIYSLLVKRTADNILKKRIQTSAKSEKESRKYLQRVFTVDFVSLVLFFVLLEFPILFDYRLYHGTTSNKQEFMAAYGSFYSKTFMLICLTSLALILPLAGFIKTLVRLHQERETSSFRTVFGTMMRLAGYVLLPFSLFYVAAGSSITGIFGNTGDTSACISMEIMGALVLLIGIDILLVFFYMDINYVQRLYVAAGVSFVLQTVVAVILSVAKDNGTIGLSASLVVFYGTLLVLLVLFMKKKFLYRNSYFKTYIKMMICAVGAAIPVFLLGGFLETVTGCLACAVILFFVYFIIYILATLFTGAVDYNNIERLPFGYLLLDLADLLNL